jgi:HAD superfamily hydrolase (TIGR01490 family)
MTADLATSRLTAARPVAEPKTLAIFDLDGTLTSRDTLFPFLRYVVGPAAFYARLPLAMLTLALMALRVVSRQRAKEWVLGLYLRGWHRIDLAGLGEAFAREKLASLLRPQASARLAWHRGRGHECAIATASLGVYVEPWSRRLGIGHVVATELEFDDRGLATGRISGHNCRGEEKLRRLEERFGDLAALNAHGYGDGPADRAFLDKCAQPHYRGFADDESKLPARAQKPNAALDFIKLVRPHQWVKNAFVFVGVVFGHAWLQPDVVLSAVLAAAAFSLTSSAIYIVNDYADRERDRLHPKKRHRPLASGRVTPRAAFVVAGVLAVAAAALAHAAGNLVVGIVAAYALMNLAYSFSLKGIVILDVFIISAGFILRILAGTLAIAIYPSQWLIVCSLFLTLFLGFTKRRAELLSTGSDFLIHRKVLLSYNASLLDKMISVCACAALMCYALYTTSPVTQEIHHTDKLVYTLPFVVYGFFRYLYLLHARHAGTDTSVDLAHDRHLIATLLGWCALTAWLIA